MSNPDLASLVKSISFKYGPNVHAERPSYVPSIPDKQLIKDSLKKLGITDFDWKQWASDCNDRNVEQEQLYATILLYTPNVAKLEIDDGALSAVEGKSNKLPWWLVHFRQFVNGRNFGRVQRFQHLRSIRVDVQYLKLRHLAPLFRLRSMRKVTLIGLVEWAHTEGDSKEALQRLFRASVIDELHVEKSFVHDSVLDVVISCITHLRVFQYWSSRDQFMVNHRNSDDYWGLSDQAGYRPYNDTDPSNSWFSSWLETFSWRDDLHTEDRLYLGALGFLSGFSKLAHLELPMAVLAQQTQATSIAVESIAANLPQSVQSLTIHIIQDAYIFYQKCLDYMAVRFYDYTPSLQHIKVIQCNNGASLSYDWQGFGRKLLDQGVAFELIRSEADSDGDWTPYINNNSSDESDSSGYEESLYSD
ncbi:uncharacterized protein N0V89_007201 [Didymosphaeria variabile]|uniref:Uncharacterized protein n=1 Tax=Didymosphaeria variabile TaxID=1932322 RepID=A0A9W8XJ65_9PLEO|nr:uncharacterized protein N0V89_007201 [Didymosphaeria variabile]KAJ4351857.1 hypothetical protein N0V89_007201 [Didymosphaeria variabile]